MIKRGDSLDAWDLEQYLIPYDDGRGWAPHLKYIPEKQREWLNENGAPIGLGKHPEKGYFINCSGQGPATVWTEWAGLE